MSAVAPRFWGATHPMVEGDWDEPDALADAALIERLVTGRAGLHPDAWHGFVPLAVEAARYRRYDYELPIRHYHKVTHTGSSEPRQQYDPGTRMHWEEAWEEAWAVHEVEEIIASTKPPRPLHWRRRYAVTYVFDNSPEPEFSEPPYEPPYDWVNDPWQGNTPVKRYRKS
jgi:hypothetical protein